MGPALCAAVRKTIERYGMVAGGQGVLVALSGGADSVALLRVLLDLSGTLGFWVAAAHLNHGLRPDAERDERFCAELAATFQVPFRASRLPPGALARAKGGVEEAGRRARYRFLASVARELGCERVATGHTRDDQVETFLLRLLRGACKPGLAGILPVRPDGVVRPLIEVSRSQVVAFLAERGLQWVEDSSNTDLRFARNRIRQQLVPLLLELQPRAAEHIAACAADLARTAEAEEAMACELLDRYLAPDGGLCLQRMRPLPLEARQLVVRAWLRRTRGHLRRVGRRHIEALAGAQEGWGTVLPGGWRVAVEGGKLSLRAVDQDAPPPACCSLECGGEVRFGPWRLRASAPVPWAPAQRFPASLCEAVFDAEQVGRGFLVRSWRPGDRLRPLGLGGSSRKLSDVFIDRKVPRRLRARWPIVEVRGEIAWVPGLVRGEMARVTSATRQAIAVLAERSARA